MDRDRIAAAVAEAVADSCSFTFARSGGPGGQNVNKRETKVVASMPLAGLSFLIPEDLVLVRARLGRAVNGHDEIVIHVQQERNQLRNRVIAADRMTELIMRAIGKRRKRVATKPGRAAKERRLKAKKALAEKKRLRGPRFDE
jgi:ribosome-associated protein